LDGWDAVIRGAILGLSLSAALPLIDISLVAKGRDAVWKAALIGGGCGLVGGVAIWGLQSCCGNCFSYLEQPLTVYLLVPPVYGLLVHAAYSFCRRRGYNLLWTANWLLAVGLVVGVMRFYPLYLPAPNVTAALEGILLALVGSLSTTAFFTLLWTLLVYWVEPRPAQWWNGGRRLVFELILTVAFTPLGLLMIGGGYNDTSFENRTADTGVLQWLPEAVMVGNKLVTAKKSMVLPADGPGGQTSLLAVRRKMVVVHNIAERRIEARCGDGTWLLPLDGYVAVALSPSGTRLAVLSEQKSSLPRRFGRITLYQLPDGGKIGETTGIFDGKCCWSRDEKFLFWAHYDNNGDTVPRVEQMVVATGEMVPFAVGRNPDLMWDSGKIAYRRGDVIYCRTPEGGPEQMLGRLDFGALRYFYNGSFAVSSDGKMLLYCTPCCNLITVDGVYYVLYDLASGRCCRINTCHGCYPWLLQWLRPEDYDTAAMIAAREERERKK
ncbi:MAG: hypothetical protein PHQ27_06685, partial [Victivallales bacterium]|nr:hypothetical protein [Victivallales bacterium]